MLLASMGIAVILGLSIGGDCRTVAPGWLRRAERARVGDPAARDYLPSEKMNRAVKARLMK